MKLYFYRGGSRMTDSDVAQQGCIICRLFYLEFSPAEVHHLREDTGLALKSKERIPLCPYHHRLGGISEAFHAGKESFETRFGTQLELYEKVMKLHEEKIT